ncbi:N-acetylneuraminate synthase [Fundidesulfovibrio agrisoli]|uniref:N-acetylneuraminate synthase n=1 Tax=Fundidesulfovibrio agrisoli TaxID=2922717 RepID=UPI001FAC9C48|nr:N-acetylneuraminate synthase [Fundidesulfovibrio agrisoli]
MNTPASPARRVLVIAEAGVNHNGDIARALDMVDAAAEAGADVIKFQTFKAERLAAASAPKAAYQKERTGSGESQLEMLKKLELDVAAHETLIERCTLRGVAFLSSPFDLESVDLLRRLGSPIFKVPSGEITNLPYLRAVADAGLPVLLSTGMADLGDVEAALAVFEARGVELSRITVLHCTTQYPTPMDEVNLRAMNTIASAFPGVNVGYSDHTKGIEVPIAAVALGATVIEKHFTLDRFLPGPDHAASLEPQELASMVCAIRNIERAMGDGRKRPTASELPNRAVARKSIVAARAILAGEAFTEENLTAKRPGTGLSPMRWDEVIGRAASRDYRPDEQIELP